MTFSNFSISLATLIRKLAHFAMSWAALSIASKLLISVSYIIAVLGNPTRVSA